MIQIMSQMQIVQFNHVLGSALQLKLQKDNDFFHDKDSLQQLKSLFSDVLGQN